MKKVIVSKDLPAVGPYSPGVVAGNTLYVSGQLPLDKTGNIITDDMKKATEQVLENLKAVIEAAGFSLSDVVKTTVFLVDLQEFAAMNEVYAKFFTSECPARATVEVTALARGARVEIDAIAVKS